ncbi:portal protein [Nitrosovibrio sp. Nv4]|uniref:portal protein n=1 Tax=Nitrosovibrio sp. Nv4 TaxID=1945880 RepID=UPI000BC603F2|nr:portal protein [Nitrosovibrio sp. Nv4]SOD41329.1 Bacteriophage head to tail connecting protein [Nitrosovibrio sp. Nv4]
MSKLSDDEIADEIIRRHEKAINERGTLDSHCEEIAERILPNYAGSFVNRGMTRIEGQKRTETMADATGGLALGRFASAMESMLTPRNSTWHRAIPSNDDLLKDRRVRLWFENLTRALFKYRYAPKANFASQKRADYLALGAFGTGCLYVDRLVDRVEKGLRYKYIHLGEIFFMENHQGIVDTAYRKFELTARQALQQFGESKLPEEIVRHAKDTNKCDQKYWFIHCVQPRSDAEGYDPERKDERGFPFTDYYVSLTRKKLVQNGGHTTFPYAISRYDVAPGEIYGRSPAMSALPSLKVLNEQKKTVLKQGHRAVDPVLLAHDDGVLDTFSMKPGAVNFGGVSAEGRALVQTLPVGNLSLAKEMMEAERAVINDFFLVTLFQILVDTPQMTATEVLERAREKGALLSPTMGRQQSESLGPMIEREIDLLAMQGLLEPMPDALREAAGEFSIEYDSPLSRAQKAEEAAGLFRTVDWMAGVINITQNPEPLDHINWDVAVPEILDIQAVPERWKRSMDEVLQMRQGRAQAAQEQQMVDAAPALASVAKGVAP